MAALAKPRSVLVRSGALRLTATLADTPTARAIWDALPIEAPARRWGDEIYFAAEVAAEVEPGATQVVPPGSLCLWCEAGIIALAFGPTPISLSDECRLAAAVNCWGMLEGDPRALDAIRAGDSVRLERCE